MPTRTPATTALEKAGAGFEPPGYDHDPEADSIGLQAAEALGLPPSAVFKTPMALAGDEPVVAMVPSDRELGLKALAAAAGRKSAATMRPAEAERISGYRVGGISPLGQRRRPRAFLDASALALDRVVVDGGQRGLQLRLSPADLAAATGAAVVPIAVG